MPHVPVVMVIAAVAVLAGVIVVALGRGGELTFFQADYAPIKLAEISATDVVLFRPPMALWGYSAQATDEALNRIADALTDRDIEIAALRQQVADLEAASPTARRRAYRGSDIPDRAQPPGPPDDRMPPGGQGAQPADPRPGDAERRGLGGPAAAGQQPPGEPRAQHPDGPDTAPPHKPAAEADGW